MLSVVMGAYVSMEAAQTLLTFCEGSSMSTTAKHVMVMS